MLLIIMPFYFLYEATIILLSYAMKDKLDWVILVGLMASQEMLEKTGPASKDLLLLEEYFLKQGHRDGDYNQHKSEQQLHLRDDGF